MGHTLEENIERIATALEDIARAQTTNMQTIKHVYLGVPLPEELACYTREKVITQVSLTAPYAPAGAPAAATPAPAVESEPEPAGVKTPKGTMDYDTLKAELIKRGISVPKGTKMTTLIKWWDKVQDERVAKVEVDENGEVSEAASLQPKLGAIDEVEPTETTPAPADAVEERKSYTREEARAHLTADYQPTSEWQQLMLSALSAVGAAKFSEVTDDKMTLLVEEFDRLREEAGL